MSVRFLQSRDIRDTIILDPYISIYRFNHSDLNDLEEAVIKERPIMIADECPLR